MQKLVLSVLLVCATLFPAGCQFIPTASEASPTAYIDSISPQNPTSEDTITFQGHGTDTDGTVVAYRWRSSIDGDLGTQASFSATLSPGNHTIYLMVQDNNGNWSTEVSMPVVVTEAEEPAPPAETAEEPPTINSFFASPDSLMGGESSTLAWDVSDADTVAIDQGIGDVALSGTTVVSPEEDTTYTLTAENSGGSVMASTLVIVMEAPMEEDAPDLVVTAITRDDTLIKYTIKNQGTADAGPSNSRLFVDGSEVATDGVAALAAGASRTETFSYSYSCSGTSDTLLVQVDKDDLVDESNEANNSYSTSWTCMLILQPPLIIVPGVLLKPDLTVAAVWESGDRIHYRIENQGALASVPCTSKLSVNGSAVASDTSVPSIAAGEHIDRTFGSYLFNCAFPVPKTVVVQVDTKDDNSESDETNNTLKLSVFCH